MNEPAEFFETGKTYSQQRPGMDAPVEVTFRCFGAWIIPEGADGAGNWLAFGYQSDSVEPDSWALMLMSRDAWLEGWTLAEEGGANN